MYEVNTNMNFDEAKAYKATFGNKIIKEYEQQKKEFEVIIIPQQNEDNKQYLNHNRGPFIDEDAIPYSKNNQFLVLAIWVNEDKTLILSSFIL